MSIYQFLFNILAALAIGVAIGLERQFRQHPAGLRTNALVCVGAALFVSLSKLLDDQGSPTRIASYVVSGIGFLGGGVIIRDGLSVKGMNTAATLWCSAAVGTLAGSGFALHALIGTATVLGLHLGLRPVAHWVDLRIKISADVDIFYKMKVLCREDQERVIRTILLRHANGHPKMTVQRISTEEADHADEAAVVVEIFSIEHNDRAMEDLLSRIIIEPGVTSASWEKVRGGVA
jgi:putative Mg2+ transporter-C (MgtC) family protein